MDHADPVALDLCENRVNLCQGWETEVEGQNGGDLGQGEGKGLEGG